MKAVSKTLSCLRSRSIASTGLGALSIAAFAAAPAFAGSEAEQAAAQQDPPTQASDQPMEQIVVTGSRGARADGFTAPTPLTVIGADQIARQGASNVAQILNEVPSFRAQSTPSTTGIFFSNLGASTADLRGLGANRTLVLIDGRRVVPATVAGGSFTPANSVDLNLVPASLVSRAEVVTGGASAAYGSDAVAGVVNLLLDTNRTGLQGSIQYGWADAGDMEEAVLGLSGGFSFAEGRGHFIFGVEYVDNQGAGDCYTRDWCALSANTISNPARVDGLPNTVITPNTRTSIASVNGLITSAGPLQGLSFNADGTTFQHDYGLYFGIPIFQSGGGDERQAFYENFPLATPLERTNLYSRAEFDINNDLTVFAEGAYAEVQGDLIGAQRRDLGSIVIHRDNAFLSPEVAAAMDANGLSQFNMGRIWNDIGPQVGESSRETMRFVTGFEASIGRGWTLDGYYQYGRTDYEQIGRNTTITPRMNFALDAVRAPDGSVACRAALQGNPDAAGCVPLSPFGQGSPSQAAIDYVTGTAEQSTRLTQHAFALTASGDLFQLPAGPLGVATGVEYREDKASGTADPISAALQFYTRPGAPIDGAIDVREVFAEAVAPLVRDAPFARSAELNAAVRYTDYSTSGGVTSWKVGGDWAVNDWLRFRGTVSRDIRAPNVFELFGPTQSSFQNILDPATGVQQLVPVLLGGNADLVPEEADTWTVGAVIERDIGPGAFSMSVDRFDIQLDGAISTLGGQTIVNRCNDGSAELCEFVTRNADGLLVSIDNSNLNLNTLITRGWDLEVSYSLPVYNVFERFFGGSEAQLSVRGMGTYVDDLITVTPDGTAINRAGQNGSPVSLTSGMPRYTLNGYLTYDANPLSMQLQVRHLSDGLFNAELIGPEQGGYDPFLPNSINRNKVGSWTIFNANASYALLDEGDRRVELYGAVNNLFDRDPPRYLPSSFGPTNNVLYDVIGRTYRMGVRFAF
jgi:iron complex outermembrane recepter protein